LEVIALFTLATATLAGVSLFERFRRQAAD
jgi:hypothetical protein